MYKELSLLKFEDIYNYFILKFIHVMQYSDFKIFINNFSKYLPLNNYNTRGDRINILYIRAEVETIKVCGIQML